MSTSPFMDDYSSEDYSDIDHDDDYYFVPAATSPQQVPAHVETQTQSNELQNLIIDDQQVDVSESVYFDVLPELEAQTAEEKEGGMVQSVYLAVESYFDLEAQAETGGVASVLEAQTTVEELAVGSYFDLEAQTTMEELAVGSYFDLEAHTTVEELAVGSYFDLEAQVETGLPAALDTETVLEEGDVIESESLETVEADTAVDSVESMIEEFICEAVESESDLEAEDAIEEPNSDVEHEADADAPQAETTVEGDVIGKSTHEAVESDYDLEAQVETGLPAALGTETVLEEGDVIEFESLETVEADTAVETVESMIEEFICEAVESESDLEAENAIEEPNSDVEHEADAVAPQAETAVEGDVIGKSTHEAVESDYDLEAQVETVLPTALGTETVLEEGDVIEPESLETVEANTAVETVESMIEEFICEAVESESDLEAEDAIEGSNSYEEHAADACTPEAETAVEEGDLIDESIYKAVESDYDLETITEAEDMVEEEGMVEGDNDMVEEEDDFVEEKDGMLEEEAAVEEEHVVIEEGDTIDGPLESENNLQAAAEALFEGVAMEGFIFHPLESNSDLQAEEPEGLAEPAVSFEMITFKSHEPDSDLSDEQSYSCEEESDLSEEEWDSDAEESDMDPSDSDLTEEEEDDVVVSYLKSPTTIRNKAWKSLVPAWAKLPVTDPTTLEDSCLLESFRGYGPMLMLQECGNALMNVIDTLLRELLRIRNDLRRVLGALFRKRETTKHA